MKFSAVRSAARIARASPANRHQFGRRRRSPSPSRRMRLDLDLRRQPAERRFDQRQARDHAGLARDDDGAAARILRHRRDRGDVAGAAEVFLERARHRLLRSRAARERRRSATATSATTRVWQRGTHIQCADGKRMANPCASAAEPAMRRRRPKGPQFSFGRSGADALCCAAFQIRSFAGATMTSSEDRRNSRSIRICRQTWRTPALIIGFGCLISLMAFGPRSSLGFFLTPLSSANHWGRDVFAFALALQNLLWGIGQPIAGMIADRFGTVRVLCVGAMHVRRRPGADVARHQRAGARCVGRRVDRLRPVPACSFTVAAGGVRQAVAAAVALARLRLRHGGRLVRAVSVFADRGRADGHVRLAADADDFRRQHARRAAAVAGADDAAGARATRGGATQSLRQALGEAFAHRSYVLLVLGFFTCGFQLAFITVHMPAYLVDRGLSAQVGGWTHRDHRAVQHRRLDHRRLARRPHAEALSAVDHLFRPRRGDPGVHLVSGHAGDLHRVRRDDGPDVAFDRAADQRHHRADVRHAMAGDAAAALPSSVTRSAASSASGSAVSCSTAPARTTRCGGWRSCSACCRR